VNAQGIQYADLGEHKALVVYRKGMEPKAYLLTPRKSSAIGRRLLEELYKGNGSLNLTLHGWVWWAKEPNTALVRSIEDFTDDYVLTWDTQEIEAILDGIAHSDPEVTAVAVLVGNAVYREVWAAYSSTPYLEGTEFYRIWA